MIGGALAGLLFGLGLFGIWSSCWSVPTSPVRSRGRLAGRADAIRDDLQVVGLGMLPVAAVPGASLGLALCVMVMTWSISDAVVPALAMGLVSLPLPPVLLRTVARGRRTVIREVWPEAVDHIASAVRAGLSLPESLAQVGQSGPEQLREPFRLFARDFQVGGDFSTALDALRDRLADPVGDRVVEALRITRDVGGTDLGVLLRTLSSFLREDARTRSELEARQSWTVNASRLAVAAPWIVLALLCTRPQAAAAFDRPMGLMVIVATAVVSVLAHRLMLVIARLPEDVRVLR